MKCKKCGNEYPSNELMNGICYDCFEKNQDNTRNENFQVIKEDNNYKTKERKINHLSSLYNTLSYIFLFLSVFGAIVLAIFFQNAIIVISCLISCLMFWLFLQTASEILQLLEDIKNK